MIGIIFFSIIQNGGFIQNGGNLIDIFQKLQTLFDKNKS
jgi:hypothetical protein